MQVARVAPEIDLLLGGCQSPLILPAPERAHPGFGEVRAFFGANAHFQPPTVEPIISTPEMCYFAG
jgi:hypothetical protein